MTKTTSTPTASPKTKPKRKSAADTSREHRLTDAYAAEARRGSLIEGDELSELASVGRKADPKARGQRATRAKSSR